GRDLLISHNIPRELARFAITHANWLDNKSILLEDLIVALADNCWKGKRNQALEERLGSAIATMTGNETWEVFLNLDNLIESIAINADQRLLWQEQFSPGL